MIHTLLTPVLAQAAQPASNFSTLDLILFCVTVVGVIALGIWKSKDSKEESGEAKKEKSASDYFLAGRGLTWWLVGFSLIAANISTEQFVGMSGKSADWLGMAIASYEWMAAITLVVVAFLFLPKLLRCGIYTIPEFLEYRYGVFARTIMALATMVILVGVPTAAVIYSGAKVVSVFFAGYSLMGLDLGDLTVGCWIIGISAALYVFVGGLKACAWTDLIWGAALIVGGGVIMYLAFDLLGSTDASELIKTKVATSNVTADQLKELSSMDRFIALNSGQAADGANLVGGKLHMVRPSTDSEIPWTALVIGLWIPNFFYWGLNQYIMQRTLGSKSLAEGQKGIVFAAFLKLIIPFVVVIPGILAFNLFSDSLKTQAVEKNKAQLAHMASDQKVKVFPISKDFANANWEQAQTVLFHNAEILGVSVAGQSPEKVYEGIEILATADPEVAAPQPVSASVEVLKTSTDQGVRLSASEDIAVANDNMIEHFKRKQAGNEGLIGDKLVAYDYDAAFPTLLSKLLKPGLSWFVLAAIFGAVVSSLASMLNSASTIFTMDIYHKLNKKAGSGHLVTVGKIGVLACVLIALAIAPKLGHPSFGGIFSFIQEFQGFISPGVLAVFLFGFIMRYTPRYFGWLGIFFNVVLYGVLKWLPATENIAFLNRMAICFAAVIVLGLLLTFLNPLKEPAVLPENGQVALESSKSAKLIGLGVCILTLILYVIFW